MEGAVEIQADRVEWSAGVAVAEGGVQVRFGEQSLVGTRATWDGTTVVVEHGTYHRPDGTFAFDRAEVQPQAGTAVVVEARAETAGALIDADRLVVGERWDATRATVVPCQCADGGPPALSFRAARITVVPEKVVILNGGVVRVFTVPVLPVPYWRVQLDPHRFRLLLPELGWGEYGPSVKIEGRGGARIGGGDWYLQGGPAWRLDTGFRGELAITGPGVVAQGALGWDQELGKVRGVGASRGGVDRGDEAFAWRDARAAWDIAYVSDDDYLTDYAVDYVTRGVAYRESRGIVSTLGGTLSFETWLPDDGSAGTLSRLGDTLELGRGRAVSVTPRFALMDVGVLGAPTTGLLELGLGARAAGGTSWLKAEARADLAGRLAFLPRVTGMVGEGDPLGAFGVLADPAAPEITDALTTIGTTRGGWGEGLADGPLARWGTGGPGIGGAVAGEVTVPIWSTLGPARIQWWPGIRAEARGSWTVSDELVGAVRAGPAVRATTGLASGGIGLDAALLQDGEGWRPAGALDVHLEKLSVRAQADPEVQGGEIRWMPGVVTLAAGTAHAGDLWLGWGDASLAVGRLRTGAGLAWDLGGAAFSGADARVGYDDGCVGATVTARFAPDRVMPDFGFAATYRR